MNKGHPKKGEQTKEKHPIETMNYSLKPRGTWYDDRVGRTEERY